METKKNVWKKISVFFIACSIIFFMSCVFLANEAGYVNRLLVKIGGGILNQ